MGAPFSNYAKVRRQASGEQDPCWFGPRSSRQTHCLAEVERLHLPIKPVDSRWGVTFGDLVLHYAEHELVERSESIHPKAHTTIKGYDRVLRNRLLPKWGSRIALGIEPLEIEEWLTTLKKEEELENPALDRLRRVMSLVYRHGQRYGLIPRTQESNPMCFVRCKTTSGYEAMIITPEQAYVIVRNLREPERTLTLSAAGTGLRISECLGLQWQDVNFAEAMIHVRRTWTCVQVGLPKTNTSKGPVPLHPLLAEFMLRWKEKTAYSEPCDWVFASFRLKGKQPRVANMLVEDYLRPAAAKAGILSSHRDDCGRLVEDGSAPVRISQPSPQSRIVLGSHQNRSKDGANSASTQRCQIDAPVLQPRCKPGSHGRRGGNVDCDSQPRGGSKRTGSRLGV
jgi:integrase